MTKPKPQVLMIIGDYHAPYEHEDAIKFLAAVKARYNPTRVIQVGDEFDGHSLSFHEKSPDLDSPKRELELVREHLKPLGELFPVMDLLDSNHGSLILRRASSGGLPSEVIKANKDILQAPKRWFWHYDLVIDTPKGPIYFHHGRTSTPGALSKRESMSAVQGHFHSNFYIHYWVNKIGMYFDMNVGCLIDHKKLAFAYAKSSLPKPVLGCAVVIEGVPHLVPMILNNNGRWIGKLY